MDETGRLTSMQTEVGKEVARVAAVSIGLAIMITRSIALMLAGLLLLAGRVAAAPRISEFMAENRSVLADEDGEFSDWIEIYNPDPTTVNLAGYALTDDPLILQKWVFPAVSIPSGGYLVVFASGKNRVNPAAQLHTNFSLETNGEYLALIAPDGTTKVGEFAPTYPVQEPDRSYGLALPLTTTTYLTQGAACRWRVPSAELPGWNGLGFLDTSWAAGVTGVGYERSPTDAVNFTALIGSGSNVNTAMYNVQTTCYIRIPFNVPNASAVFGLTLRMKYDDGFIAYINGVQVKSANAYSDPAYDAYATGANPDANAVAFQSYDISKFRSALVNGTNVLAIHGLNAAFNSSDFIIVPQLEGVIPNAGGAIATGYFATPTPGTVNGLRVDGFVKDTRFSVDRGFFSAPFPLTISTNTPGAVIRYTTNGSAPTATTGTIYSGPITISATTVIRAAAFITGWQPSNVDTQTYIFASSVRNQSQTQPGFPLDWGREFDFNTGQLGSTLVAADYQMDPAITTAPAYTNAIVPALENTLPVLSITGDTQAIFGTNGIYSDGRLTAGLELPASVEFFGPGSGAGFRVNCGLRIHGGDALIEHPKKPFRLYFRDEYGMDTLDFPFFPNSPVRKFKRLQLRGGGHDGWAVPFGGTSNDLAFHATYVRDQFLRQTELDQGRLSPSGRYVHVYINGLYWGFYVVHEVPGDDYFKSHLGGVDAEDWDVVEQPSVSVFDVVDGNGDAMTALLALCTPATNPANASVYAQIKTYLDVDEFIDHMIVQIWGCQNDWMGPVFRQGFNYSRFFNKNWNAGRLSRGATRTGFLFSVWDAEISMGAQLVFSNVGGRIVDFDHTRVGETGFGSTAPGPPAQIYNALRSNAEFRLRFGDRLQKHFFNDGVLTPAAAGARLASLRNLLVGPIVAESARWGDVNGVDFSRDDHWLPEMNWLRDTFMTQRTGIVLGQFRSLGLYPSIDAPSFNQFGGSVGSTFPLVMTNPNASGQIYYTTDGSDPRNGAIPSAGAQLYTGPVLLTQTGDVKARVLNAGTWSAVTETTFIVGVPATAANLLVSEIHYEPAEPTAAEIAAGFTLASDFEYIELFNPTSQVLELTGLEFIAGVVFEFADGSIKTLIPGGRVLVVKNAAAFAFRFGAGLPVTGVFQNGTTLANGGERLAVIDDFGNSIFDFTYDSKSPWPDPPAGSGMGIVLVRPELLPNPALASNWRLSRISGGSPASDDRPSFAAWLAGNDAGDDELGDADGDGLSNLIEYALGGNPNQPFQAAPLNATRRTFSVGGVPAEYFTVTLRRQYGAEDVATFVEFSADLATWSANGVLEDVDVQADGSSIETWRAPNPIGGAGQFARVRVEK